MLTKLQPTTVPVATLDEHAAMTALLTEGQAPVSDAPLPCPSAIGVLLLLLSPKKPSETDR